jgi:hypothetical protein
LLADHPSDSKSFLLTAEVPMSRHHLALRASSLLLQAALLAPAGATTIRLDNTGNQCFAVDPERHLLYAGERLQRVIDPPPPGTLDPAHLDVIDTMTNSVVGGYSITSTYAYTCDLAASGTQVFWADRGDNVVHVFNVGAAGVPSLARTDSLPFPTGLAALPTTYGECSQGGGDSFNIVRSSDGAVLHTTPLRGTGGAVHGDMLCNRYYVQDSSNAVVIDAATGATLRTISGLVSSVDSTKGRHFVYVGEHTHVLQQLTGDDDSPTGRSFDFGDGAYIDATAVDAASGNIWVALAAQDRVAVLSPDLRMVQQFSLPMPEAIALDNGNAYVHLAETSTISVLSVGSVPEPTSTCCLGAAIGALRVRRPRRRH